MTATIVEIEASREWRNRGVLVAIGAAAVMAILYSTYREIFHFWWTFSAYNHCILIVPIALFLAYEKRGELLSRKPGISWVGFTFFLLNIILWSIGGFFSFAVFQHAAGIGLVIGLIWSLIGNSRARVIAFPLLYLYFGVPEGEILVPYLRDLTADVVVNLLRMTGIPVFMEGRYLTIPSGQFHVAKACSGINYLIATLAVGTVFAYTRYKSNWRRLAFMILAILVPLIANGLRAYGIVMIAHLSNYKYALGVDHYIYGWVFFGVVIFILFAVGNTFSDNKAMVPDRTNIKWVNDTGTADRTSYSILVLGLSALLVVNAMYLRVTAAPNVSDRYELAAGPQWHLSGDSLLNLHGSFEGQPIVLEAQLDSIQGASSAWLQMVLYLNPEIHGELENRANLLFDEEKWQRLNGPDLVQTEIKNYPSVHEFVLRRNGKEHLLWTWYDVDGYVATSRADVKWALTKARITRTYRGGAQLSLVTPMDTTVNDSRNLLRQILREVGPSMPNLRKIPQLPK